MSVSEPTDPSPSPAASDQAASFFGRIWRSVLPGPLIPTNEVERRRFLLRNLVFHFRPTTVPRRTLRFSLTWGLGGTAAVLVIVQLCTGILLKFGYEPTPVSAYASVQMLTAAAPFGRLIRNLHHWCAHLLVLVVFLHLLRIYFTGAFHPPRQFNWIIGLGLMGVVLAANFTGYLLPWDQLAYWAVTVSTGMLAYVPWVGPALQGVLLTGTDLSPDTLRFFFAVHTAVVPVLLAALMGFHFWRIRKAGGLVIPRSPSEQTPAQPSRVPTVPDLLLRECVTALVVLAGVLMLSIFADAPLGEPANPGLSPNPTKAPWYFAGFQELLLHIHPVFAVTVLPLFFGLLLLMIPYLNYRNHVGGVWFVSVRGRKTALLAALVSLVATPAGVAVSEKLLPGAMGAVTGGLVPFGLLVLAGAAFYLFVKRFLRASSNEAVQALFVLMATAFVILTAVNVWFRGQGMALVAPW